MFDIFIKKSSIVVDCFTANPGIYTHHPIFMANESFPDWWKPIKATTTTERYGIEHEQATIKRCDGIIGLYSYGFCIPLWSDLIIESNTQGEFRFLYSSEDNPPITTHTRNQFSSYFDNLIHIKIQSPWLIEEKTGVNFHFNQAAWSLLHHSYHMNIVPAIINFKDQSSTHINLFMPKKQNRIELVAGQPLLHIIPLSDKKIILKNHLISEEEHKRKLLTYSYMSSFVGRYKKLKKTSNGT
jgi:hypothetical protein